MSAAETEAPVGRAKLPTSVISKLRRVDDELEDLSANLRGLAAAEDRARNQIQDLRLQLDRAREADMDRLPHVRAAANAAWRASTKELITQIETKQAFLARNAKALDALNARLSPLRALRDAAEDWHASTTRTADVAAFSGELRLPAKADLASIRTRIATAKADIRATLDAPRSLGELQAAVDREVDRLRQAGAPNFTGVIDGISDHVGWPSITQSVQSHGFTKLAGGTIVSAGQFRVVDAAAIMAWLHPDAMRKALHAELKAQLGGDGISQQERADRLRVLRRDLLALERIEEAVIEREQPETPRRADLDLRAFLGLADECLVPGNDD